MSNLTLQPLFNEIKAHARRLRTAGSISYMTGKELGEEYERAKELSGDKFEDEDLQPHLAPSWKQRAQEFLELEIPKGGFK
ncbi:MAG TPA: hypothetical protein VHP58_05220 [Alphaproteobacteria bacterium]|nr:hypothetical protein [Alphaproteobacteria bacterium]